MKKDKKMIYSVTPREIGNAYIAVKIYRNRK